MESHSLRAYQGLRGVWEMVARNAFTQLRYSTANLVFAVVGMLVTYLAGPFCLFVALFIGDPATAVLGGAIWLLMAVSFMPILQRYGKTRLAAFLMPVVATLYMAMTLDSACRYWWGAGGEWKGRVTARSPRQRQSHPPPNA